MMAPGELQGTILEYADCLQNSAQFNEKCWCCWTAGADCTTPTPRTWDTLVRTVTTGQSLVWKTRILALLDEEIIAIDVEAWVTLRPIGVLKRAKGKGSEGNVYGRGTGGDRRQRMGQGEGTSRERNRQREGERHCDMQPLWQTRTWPTQVLDTHPEQLPWKGANSLGYGYDVVEDRSLDICSVEAGKWVATSSHRARHRVDQFAPTVGGPA